MNSIEIATLTPAAETQDGLAELLVATVAAGGSVSFMHPLAPQAARVSGRNRWPRRQGAKERCLAPGTAKTWSAP